MNAVYKISFLMLAICVAGCKKSDPIVPKIISESNFFFSNTNAGGVGTISTYKKPGGIAKDAVYTLPTRPATIESIADMAIYNGGIYIIHSVEAKIEVARLGDLAQIETIEYAKPLSVNIYKRIGATDGKIFIADRDFLSKGNTQNAAFLKVVTIGKSKIDSIGIMKNAPITAIAVSSGRVYVSAGTGPQTIFVVDANSYATIATIPLAGFCTDLLIDNANNILAFYNGRMTKFSGSSFAVLKDKLIGGAPVNIESDDTRTNSAYGFDKDNNIIYFLSNAPQPAVAPYFLKSYDLNKDEITLVSHEFFSALSVGFDKGDKEIILGSYDFVTKGNIKFISLTGEVRSQFTISGPPMGIQVDQ
jgi:hypothetical protein